MGRGAGAGDGAELTERPPKASVRLACGCAGGGDATTSARGVGVLVLAVAAPPALRGASDGSADMIVSYASSLRTPRSARNSNSCDLLVRYRAPR